MTTQNKEWVVTDPDTEQQVRWMGGRHYEVFEQGRLFDAHLGEYSDAKLQEYLSLFHDMTLTDFCAEHGLWADGLLAEMIAEVDISRMSP